MLQYLAGSSLVGGSCNLPSPWLQPMICYTKSELNSLIPAPSVEKQRKTWFTYFGAVNTLTPFGKTAING